MLLKTSRKSGSRRIVTSQSLVDEFRAKEMSRREMVQKVMLGTVGAGLAACTTTTIKEEKVPAENGNGTGTGTGTGTEQPGTETPKHLVGLGYDEADRNVALEAALKETIGLGMIKAGQSVYLRVNANSGDPYPYSTSPDTLKAIGTMLKDIGVTDIRVGDRSFWGDQDTAGNLQANGITAAAKAIGVTAKAYDDSVDWVDIPSDTPNWTGTVRLPTEVTTADHMIVLSIVKTHFISQITMSLKIALGLVHADDRARDGNLKSHNTSVLYKQIAQINKGFTPSLIVQDGYKAVISGGPTVADKPQGAPSTWKGGVVGDPKIFIVSTDRIAADVAGIAVLQTLSPTYELVTKTAPFENPQIKAAIALGLGITGPDEWDASGPTVPNFDELKAKVTG
jgi:uncharacterized protein (DUF362 family)